MNRLEVLKLLIRRIRDQRFLFYLASVIVAAGLAGVDIWLTVGVLAGAFLLAVLDRILAFYRPPQPMDEALETTSVLEIALTFRGPVEPSDLRFERCDCRIEDPRGCRGPRQHQVKPHLLGGGWLCPIPSGTKPEDVIEITLTDKDGRRWVVGPVACSHLWPKVEATILE